MNDHTEKDAEAREFTRLVNILRELRERCPWDREQTLPKTSRHVIEEAYEVSDAIAREKQADVAEELGDLVSQSLFAAVMLAENSEYKIAGLLSDAADKLVRRHPHVYGTAEAATAEQVLHQWDQIKNQEQPQETGRSKLTKTGRALPSLMRAEKLGEKARRLGMDWADARHVLAKVREELDEAERALESGNQSAAAEEIGDMMLALANVPRFINHNAEEVLRRSCDKFVARFTEVERLTATLGKNLESLPPEEIESLWQQAKRSLAAREAGEN